MSDDLTHLSDIFGSLEAKALDNAAEQLERRAAQLRREADQRRKAEAAARAWNRNREKLAATVRGHMAKGLSEPEAVALTAHAYRVSEASVAFYVARARRESEVAARDRRYAEVMRRTDAGQSAAQIADAMGLHPKSVSRIRRVMRERLARSGRPLSRGPLPHEKGPLAWREGLGSAAD